MGGSEYMEGIEIDLTFKTVDFMKPTFIIDMLKLVGFNEKYKLLKCWENKKGKCSEKELLEIFHDIPFYVPYLKFVFEEKDIELEICNSWISSFSSLIISGLKEVDQCNEILQKLLNYFDDRFYSMICYDRNFVYHQRVDIEKNFIVNFLALNLAEYNPGYIYRHYGAYFGSAWKMYYGKYFYDLISKEQLLSFHDGYENLEENNVVKTVLFENPFEASTKENLSIQRRYKKKMKFLNLYKRLRANVYTNYENNTDYLKGYEDEKCYYIEERPKNKYIIELSSDETLTLKKYKNSVFYFIDDDLGVGECYALFLYTDDGHFPNDASIEEPPARLTVMSNWTNKSIKEYALENGYKYKRISSVHYVMEKEDEKKLEIRHLYTTKEGEEYEIDLEVTKSKLREEELEKVLDEYNKIIKSKRVREME